MRALIFPVPTAVFLALLAAALWTVGCGLRPAVPASARLAEVPEKMLWAWERPEDLSAIDIDSTGVAFLAQTLTLSAGSVDRRPRMQPLRIPPGTYLMAVTRIEASRRDRPALNEEQVEKVGNLVLRTLKLPNVRSVQIDFDAVVSERIFYRKLLECIRKRLPADTVLSITSLASWCVGDRWFDDLPVDEVVPMAFQMGDDEQRIRTFLENGNDWKEPLCRNSYGLMAGDTLIKSVDKRRRIYLFNNAAWRAEDIGQLTP